MRYLLIAALIAALPVVGFAQQNRNTTAEVEDIKVFGIHVDQAVAVGLGIVGGAFGLHLIVGGGSATLVGALAGAMIGNWWYEQRSNETGGAMTVNYTAR